MEPIQNQMNLEEHCTECGAMLVDMVGTLLCPHCGYEMQSLEGLPIVFITPKNTHTQQLEPIQQAA